MINWSFEKFNLKKLIHRFAWDFFQTKIYTHLQKILNARNKNLKI